MIKKKHIRLTDDLQAGSVKMVCDCGWEEKAFLQDAINRAASHIQKRHTNGVVHYKDWAREITKTGKIGPVFFNHG